MSYRADPITMQVIRYGLESIADDMGFNLMRMGRTTIVKEIMDINCGVLDAQGGILAQAHLCPLMMFSLPTTAATMLKHIEEYNPGDVIICNDPYLGGQHLLDVQFFSPVFVRNKLVAFVANIAHHLDMGGAVPGGVAGGLTEIYQEGLRIPFVKLYCRGREDPQIFSMIASNIRIPEKTMEDFRAQAATTLVGVKRIGQLIDKVGLDVFKECTTMLMDYSERKMRLFIESLPDGDYKGVDYLDDDGCVDESLTVQVNVHIRGDTMLVDFEGTSPQARGNINSPWSCTQGGVFYTMVGIVDPHMALNSGVFRPIRVESSEGLITRPLPPAGVTARSQTMTKIVEAMLKAMSRLVPDRVVAGSDGQACTNSFGGIHPKTGKRFSYIEIQGGGAGARPSKDGPDGQDLHLGRFMNTPVEAAELEHPVIVERYEFISDSGGPGLFRGGLSLRRDIRFLTDVVWARYSDRQKHAPQGLFGGMEGSKGSLVLNPDTEEEKRGRSKGVDHLKAGDLLSIRLPGSGGYGPPWERDPERVRWDVLNGKVSLESAGKNYRVVLNEDLEVDWEATVALRAEGKGGRSSRRGETSGQQKQKQKRGGEG
jgi:N-methylhydantoinase B